MLQTKPLKSSTFRLTLAYLGLFGLSSTILLVAIYIMTARFNDLQVRTVIEEEIAWLRDQSQTGGIEALERLVAERSAVEPNRRAIYLLVDPLGGRLAGNIDFWPRRGRPTPDSSASTSMSTRAVPVRRKSHPALAKVFISPAGYGLLVGRDIHDLAQAQQQVKTASFLGIGAIVVLGLVGGLILSRWMLARLERINRSTTRIMEGELGRRIAIRRQWRRVRRSRAEPERHARPDRAAAGRHAPGQRGYRARSAHAAQPDALAHRGGADGRAGHRRGAVLLEQTLQDADRLIETFNALLAIARAEAGAQQGDWERLDLAEVARDVADLYEPLAEEGSIRLRLDLLPGAIILCHRQLVSQAIANVADNAVKYTPAGGTVTIATSPQPEPTVTISRHRPRHSGRAPRITPSNALFVSTPNAATPGSGLGLSLVDAVAKLHEAKLTLEDNRPGLRVTLAFKAAAAQRVEPTAQAA